MMKKPSNLAVFTASAGLFALLITASAFADSSPRDGTSRVAADGVNSDKKGYQPHYRDHERVSVEGRVRSVVRDRDGYRVELDRGASPFWLPQERYRSFTGSGSELRSGVPVRLGGVFIGGVIRVDSCDWIDGGSYDGRFDGRSGYRDGYVRGIVEGVDLPRQVLVVREYDGAMVTVDMVRVDRRGGANLNDLRRGDRVELSGEWVRDVFRARRIESVRGGNLRLN